MNQVFGETVRLAADWIRFAIVITSRLAVAAVGFLMIFTFLTWVAAAYVTNPVREKITTTPTDSDIPSEEVSTTTSDGIELVAWFLPGWNDATVIAQHGYRGNRESLLFEGIGLNKSGYNVLLTTSRAHDQNQGGQITFGAHEMKDLEAWYLYLLARDDVNPNKIGILGQIDTGGFSDDIFRLHINKFSPLAVNHFKNTVGIENLDCIIHIIDE